MKVIVKKKGDIDLKSKLVDVNKLTKSKDLLGDLTDLAYNHFMESFPDSPSDNGGGKTDDSSSGWLKRSINYKHPALNKTGKLIKSIKKNRKKGMIYSDLDYASYQNTGGGWLPKREFIGYSSELNRKTINLIKTRINKIFKK